jgi:transposase InsO family protein
VRRWREACRDGLSAAQAARAVGVPRSSLYRWQAQPIPRSKAARRRRQRNWPSPALRELERLRRQQPMWGKAKLGPLLRKAGCALSDSTVGRMLKHLVERGAIQPVPLCRRRAKGRRPSRPHAQRLPKGLKAGTPGGLVQLDTLTVNPTGERSIKQFTAYDPVSRFTAAQAFRRATAHAAAQFLDKLTTAFPFPVQAIQVDGGSEFMAKFEAACQAKAITLYVLPPKSPQLNGGVERANGSWRYEFYACHDLPNQLDPLNREIDRFADLYNTYRPHGALNGLTPAEYLQAITAKKAPASHMS